MELVYLWVEEYKNIKKQGFNFSPRFECKFHDKYDENNKLKNDCLLEINSKEYTSIFPDNINITAIVGENGSGKSSLFELILNEDKNLDESFLLIIEEENQFYYISNRITLDNLEKFNRTFSKIYFSNQLSSIEKKNNLPLTITSHLPKHVMQSLVQLYKELTKDNYFSIYETEIGLFTLSLQSILHDNPLLFKDLDKRIYFSHYKYQIDFSILRKNIEKDSFYVKALDHSKDCHTSLILKFLIISRLKSSFIYGEHVDVKIKKNRKIFNKCDFDINDYSQLTKQLDTIYEPINTYNRENVETFIDKFSYKINDIWVTDKVYRIEDQEDHIFFSYWRLLLYFRIDFYKNGNEDIDYLSLSSGEREYIKLLVNFIYSFSKENKEVYLFDEVDLSLHPNWQKRLLSDIIKYLTLFEKGVKTNLIFSTHSPFILSDLPKENVLFLNDGKQEKAFEHKQTFGANIHTLLSDGFFMSDGLMGEFAKSKINDVIKYLKKEKSRIQSDKEAKNIIDIIGEPILKNTLMTMYDEKIYSKESKLDKLNRKKLQLEEEIKELEEKPSESS